MTPNPSPNPKPAGDPLATADDQHLVLVKHGRRYVFPCAPGHEADLMAQMATLIHDPTNDLTWFDAALLCHQMGERMSQRLSRMHSQKSA